MYKGHDMNNSKIENKDGIEKTVPNKKEEELENQIIDLLNQVEDLIGFDVDDSVLEKVFIDQEKRIKRLAVKLKAKATNSDV